VITDLNLSLLQITILQALPPPIAIKKIKKKKIFSIVITLYLANGCVLLIIVFFAWLEILVHKAVL